MIFVIFIKIKYFPSILTFSTQNHLILTYFTHLDTPIFSTNTIISTVSAIRKSKWIISINKASYEVNIHVNAKLFFSSWRTMFVWSGNFQGHACAGRFTRPYWILTACKDYVCTKFGQNPLKNVDSRVFTRMLHGKNLTQWYWPLTLKINRVPDSPKD